MAYKSKKEFLEKVDGIIAIAKHQGITINDLETAHVDRSGETPRILGFLPPYMIWWAHTEKRKDIVERLTAELQTARGIGANLSVALFSDDADETSGTSPTESAL